MQEPGSKIRAAASLNNAGWCAAVWASHGLRVARAAGLLMTRDNPPPFYPNAVTLNPTDVPQQMSFLANVSRGREPFAVKDSFGLLELEALGFRRLFEARWLWRRWEGTRHSLLDWRRIDSAEGMEQWEQSRRRATGGPADVLPPALIAQPAVAVLAGFTSRGRIAAGGIAYASAGVVGVTNLFGDTDGFLSAAAETCGNPLLVRYERGQGLDSALADGFEDAGTLCVWVSAS